MKKIFVWWRRSFREGSIQLWRHKFLSLTTIGLGTLILVLLNFVFATQFFADHSIQSLESRADFSIPLREPYDAFEFDALKNSLKEFDIETEVLSAENLSEFRVPTRVHVKFLDIQQASDVLEVFKNPRYIEVVGNWDGTAEREFVSVVEKLLKLRKNVEMISRVLVFLFLIGGILLVINTFQIAIFSRRDEIFIGRLVGAKPAFITGPFIIEGILLGLLSALFSIILFVFILRQLPVLPTGQIFLHLWNNIFAIELLIAAAVGGIGAWWSIRRYLRGRLD